VLLLLQVLVAPTHWDERSFAVQRKPAASSSMD
jgi:hypothetical protein